MDKTLFDLKEKIKELRRLSEDILEIGGHIQTVSKNMKKIMANIKMLELNLCDVADLEADYEKKEG